MILNFGTLSTLLEFLLHRPRELQNLRDDKFFYYLHFSKFFTPV